MYYHRWKTDVRGFSYNQNSNHPPYHAGALVFGCVVADQSRYRIVYTEPRRKQGTLRANWEQKTFVSEQMKKAKKCLA